ncbi:hypothetical protein CsSME_00017934 [Camellia sinensis var. sinensis]
MELAFYLYDLHNHSLLAVFGNRLGTSLRRLTPVELLRKDQGADCLARRSLKTRDRSYYDLAGIDGRRSPDHDSSTTGVMQLRVDVVYIINTLLEWLQHGHLLVSRLKIKGFVDELDHAHKVTWDNATTQIFLECIRDEILAGRRVGTAITVIRYKEIALKFAKCTGRRHEMKQLKNKKYGSLKKEWQAWNKLMDSSKGVIGNGLDRETGLFITSEEWWEKLKSKAADVGDGESNSWTLLGCYHLLSHTDRSLTHLQTPPPSILTKQTPGQRGKKEAVQSQKYLTVRHETSASQKYDIEACMQRIMAIPDFIRFINCEMWNGQCSNHRNYDDVIVKLADEQEDLQTA